MPAHNLSHPVLLLVSFLIFTSGLVLMLNVEAQQPCPDIPRINFPKWRPGAIVTVYFDEDFQWSEPVTNAIKRAFDLWTEAGETNGSGVRFEGFQRGPYPDRSTARDVFIVTKCGTQPSAVTLDNDGSDGYAAMAKMCFPESVNLEPPEWDPDGWGLTGTSSHEIGHTFNLGDCYTCSNTTMCVGCGVYGPTDCDNIKVTEYNGYPTPTPTPTPTPETCPCMSFEWASCPDYCFGPVDFCEFPNTGCPTMPAGIVNNGCDCYRPSPVLIDVNGDGFALTNAANGVDFNIDGAGGLERISWTASGSDDAWLVLDRDGNARIEDGTELFGSFTPQPSPPPGEQRNGFLALAEYDKTENGGNRDGKITPTDAIFSSLRLWQDKNHNGLSETYELHHLPEFGLSTIYLDYKISKRTDRFGNLFRYRAKLKDTHGAQLGRWAWDVILLGAP